MSHDTPDELSQLHTVLLLRWVLIIATSYLVLFSRPLAQMPPAVPLFVAAYLGTNVLLAAFAPHIHSQRLFDIGVVLFDICAVCMGLILTKNKASDFFPVYFLVVFVGALTERPGLAVGAAALIGVVHLTTLSQFVDTSQLLAGGYIMRIPFLFVVALFLGFAVARVRAQERAEQSRERQHRRSEVLTAITHDLKNPLAVIQSLAGMLLDGDAEALTASQADLVRRIHANVRRLTQLAVNLLDAARIDAGRLALQRSRANLGTVVDDALSLARSASDIKGVALQCVREPNLPDAAFDALQMERVVSNLLDNAIKYTPPGGEVIVSTRSVSDQLVLEVRDNGPGIAPHELAAVFEKFHRRAENSDIEGSGLGLFIVKAIVEAHAGTVSIESTLGKGTAVAVWLPVMPPEHTWAASAVPPARWQPFSVAARQRS